MDINCTDPCAYQSEGKCMLKETPASLTSASGPNAYASICPFFTDGVVRAGDGAWA